MVLTYIYISIITCTSKDLLIEFIYRCDGVEVNVLEIQDRLDLSRVPYADASVQGTWDE